MLVNGPEATPLYKFLRKQQPQVTPPSIYVVDTPASEPDEVDWNYEKFLVDRGGQPVRRYRSEQDPMDFEADVALTLAGTNRLMPVECLDMGPKVCAVEPLLGG